MARACMAERRRGGERFRIGGAARGLALVLAAGVMAGFALGCGEREEASRDPVRAEPPVSLDGDAASEGAPLEAEDVTPADSESIAAAIAALPADEDLMPGREDVTIIKLSDGSSLGTSMGGRNFSTRGATIDGVLDMVLPDDVYRPEGEASPFPGDVYFEIDIELTEADSPVEYSGGLEAMQARSERDGKILRAKAMDVLGEALGLRLVVSESPVAGFRLTVAEGGVTGDMEPGDPDGNASTLWMGDPETGAGTVNLSNRSADEIAAWLEDRLEAPVVNATDLEGDWNLSLEIGAGGGEAVAEALASAGLVLSAKEVEKPHLVISKR